MSPELRTISSPTIDGSETGVRAVPQFVSILNGKETGAVVGAATNCISPNPPLPPPCVGRPPTPCVGRPPAPCVGRPPTPCYGQPPPCYGGR